MNLRATGANRLRIPAMVAAAALAVTAAAPLSSVEAGAASKVIAGVVDVNTNLGYLSAAAAGTGMVLTSNGYVLTNNHVIRDATTIKVRDVDNGHTYVATVVGYDVSDDIAVLRLKGATGLKTVTIGDSSSVKAGAKVTAIGNAGGVGGTPSSVSGTVTGLGKSITALDELDGTSEQLTGLIETNAAIESGDSGGPLINAAKETIGMNTAASSGFEFQPGTGGGFAIPINTAVSIASKIENGKFSGVIHRGATAFLGVEVENSGYFQNGSFLAGVLVVGVVPASPAEKAGLGYGDVVTTLNGKSITTPSALTNAVLGVSPGAKMKLGWVDQFGTAHSATVTLASGPPQ